MFTSLMYIQKISRSFLEELSSSMVKVRLMRLLLQAMAGSRGSSTI